MARDLDEWAREEERKKMDEWCELVLSHHFSSENTNGLPEEASSTIPFEAWLVGGLVALGWVGFFVGIVPLIF